MNDNDGLVDVHAHFTTDGYIDHARVARHNEPDGMPEGYWPQWSACRHLELMDRTSIARAILSLSSPGVHFGNRKRESVSLRRKALTRYFLF